jgi:hypothetical protein
MAPPRSDMHARPWGIRRRTWAEDLGCQRGRRQRRELPRKSSRGPIRLIMGDSFATRPESGKIEPEDTQHSLPTRSSRFQTSASRRMDAPNQGQPSAGPSIRRSFRLLAQESNQQSVLPTAKTVPIAIIPRCSRRPLCRYLLADNGLHQSLRIWRPFSFVTQHVAVEYKSSMFRHLRHPGL